MNKYKQCHWCKAAYKDEYCFFFSPVWSPLKIHLSCDSLTCLVHSFIQSFMHSHPYSISTSLLLSTPHDVHMLHNEQDSCLISVTLTNGVRCFASATPILMNRRKNRASGWHCSKVQGLKILVVCSSRSHTGLFFVYPHSNLLAKNHKYYTDFTMSFEVMRQGHRF